MSSPAPGILQLANVQLPSVSNIAQPRRPIEYTSNNNDFIINNNNFINNNNNNQQSSYVVVGQQPVQSFQIPTLLATAPVPTLHQPINLGNPTNSTTTHILNSLANTQIVVPHPIGSNIDNDNSNSLIGNNLGPQGQHVGGGMKKRNRRSVAEVRTSKLDKKLGLPTYPCSISGCPYTSTELRNITIHKSSIHDIDVKWTHCDIADCQYKAKRQCYLRSHKANIHNIDVNWYTCAFDGCDFKAKENSHLTRHKSQKHEIGVRWYLCEFLKDDNTKCEYKAKDRSSVKQHKAMIHGVDVKFYSCGENNCDYKAKLVASIKRHKKRIHEK